MIYSKPQKNIEKSILLSINSENGNGKRLFDSRERIYVNIYKFGYHARGLICTLKNKHGKIQKHFNSVDMGHALRFYPRKTYCCVFVSRPGCAMLSTTTVTQLWRKTSLATYFNNLVDVICMNVSDRGAAYAWITDAYKKVQSISVTSSFCMIATRQYRDFHYYYHMPT